MMRLFKKLVSRLRGKPTEYQLELNVIDVGVFDRSITGEWVWKGDRMVIDDQCQRIGALVNDKLVEVTTPDGGWTTLFVDPDSRQLWERTYPRSEMHGGGPPALTRLTLQEAQTKFSTMLSIEEFTP